MREPKFITDLRHKVEHEWFGTLTRFGSRLGIPVSKLRVFFIYSLGKRYFRYQKT